VFTSEHLLGLQQKNFFIYTYFLLTYLPNMVSVSMLRQSILYTIVETICALIIFSA